MRLLAPAIGGAIIALVVATAFADGGGDLLRAMASGDRRVLERAAQKSSAHALRDHLESGERHAMIAASLAAPLVADSPLLVESLAIAANSPDRTVALGAARAALRILDENERERFDELEVDRALLGDALRRWHQVARDDTRWADVRVIALEVSRDLADQMAQKPAAPLLELFNDADPEVRVVAFQLLPEPLPPEHIERVAAAVTGDPDRHVALAAAASMCGGLAFGDKSDPVTALGDRGIAVIVDLILDPTLEGAGRLAAAHCLTSMNAGKTLAKLPATLAPHLREAARRIGHSK